MLEFFNPRQGDFGGSIEVICGSMFSGKTEEFIRRLKRARIAGQQVIVFKPMVDNRYGSESVVSHDQREITCMPVLNEEDILRLGAEYDVIGLDEAQFFKGTIVGLVKQLADQGKRVIIAGLDMDFKGEPFGPMPQLMATAEHVSKLQAVCMTCGNPALYSFRKVVDEEQVLLGAQDNYEPICRKCYQGKKEVVKEQSIAE